MKDLLDSGDPVRDAIAHGEAAPAAFASWPVPELLRRLRIRFSLNRKQLAAKADVSASLIGRAEKGADVRLSTLRKIYAAVGCRLLVLPAGALYEMDWTSAHLENAWFDESSARARYRRGSDDRIRNFGFPGETEIHGNAISLSAPEVK
jgi:transcriptional regulator with XRE-family HTH domain